MKVSYWKDRFGCWWCRVTPPWRSGYRISTLFRLDECAEPLRVH